jgi:hypothetical protein
MESLYLLIECEKIILKCEDVCDLYGGSGACNRKLVNPKVLVTLTMNTCL